MAVYVDPLMNCLVSAAWRWPQSCHLFADTIAELHEFAVRKLGMKSMWFQEGRNRRFPHYDLTPTRRADAVARGAIELDRRATVAKWRDLGFREL